MTAHPVTTIEARYYFVKAPTRLNNCIGCKETIYSESFDLIMDLKLSDSQYKTVCSSVCASCYGLLDESFKENYPLLT